MITYQHPVSQIIYSIKYSLTSYLQPHNWKEKSPKVLTKPLTCLTRKLCGHLADWATWSNLAVKMILSMKGLLCSIWAFPDRVLAGFVPHEESPEGSNLLDNVPTFQSVNTKKWHSLFYSVIIILLFVLPNGGSPWPGTSFVSVFPVSLSTLSIIVGWINSDITFKYHKFNLPQSKPSFLFEWRATQPAFQKLKCSINLSKFVQKSGNLVKVHILSQWGLRFCILMSSQVSLMI